MSATRIFNGPVETGLRTLVLLVESFPQALDLHRLVTLDYILVHSGDVEGGPDSVHPPSPLRSGEVAIRRELIEDGLHLYRARGLVGQDLSSMGIAYRAEEFAAAFLDSLTSTYVRMLRARSEWIFESVGRLSADELERLLRHSLGRWRTEFAVLGEEDEGAV